MPVVISPKILQNVHFTLIWAHHFNGYLDSKEYQWWVLSLWCYFSCFLFELCTSESTESDNIIHNIISWIAKYHWCCRLHAYTDQSILPVLRDSSWGYYLAPGAGGDPGWTIPQVPCCWYSPSSQYPFWWHLSTVSLSTTPALTWCLVGITLPMLITN